MYRRTAVFVLATLIFTSACDRAEEGAESATPTTVAGAQDGAEEAPDESTSSSTFDHAREWKPCAAMPAELASKALGVPAVETHEFGKICIHEHKGAEGTETYAQLGALNVFETVDKAKFRFEASTRDTSAAEMKKQTDEVRAKAKKKLDEEANAEGKKKVADEIAEALDGAATYEAVPGVGDEAAMNKQDGQLHVRVGNAYFYVLAWAGPTIGDRSAATTDEIKQKRVEHLAKNWDQQKKLQIDLAKAVITHMQKM